MYTVWLRLGAVHVGFCHITLTPTIIADGGESENIRKRTLINNRKLGYSTVIKRQSPF